MKVAVVMRRIDGFRLAIRVNTGRSYIFTLLVFLHLNQTIGQVSPAPAWSRWAILFSAIIVSRRSRQAICNFTGSPFRRRDNSSSLHFRRNSLAAADRGEWRQAVDRPTPLSEPYVKVSLHTAQAAPNRCACQGHAAAIERRGNT